MTNNQKAAAEAIARASRLIDAGKSARAKSAAEHHSEKLRAAERAAEPFHNKSMRLILSAVVAQERGKFLEAKSTAEDAEAMQKAAVVALAEAYAAQI